jgi:hypothetical protein
MMLKPFVVVPTLWSVWLRHVVIIDWFYFMLYSCTVALIEHDTA